MRKKALAMLMAMGMMTTAVFGGATVVSAAEKCSVAISLADQSDYFIGTMLGAAVEEAFKGAGADVQILDGANDVQNQVNQIQNAITGGADIIYIFPAGDGEVYCDVLEAAKDAGVKTLMSNNYPGEGYATSYVGADEFQVGVMMAELVSDWVDEHYPDAEEEEVGALILEASSNQNMIKRCLGMRMIGEKFLRKADMATIYFEKEDGDPVTYIDEDGNEVDVDEPTGGLILDDEGHAQLNPYYNEKVKIIEYSNRNSTGYDSTEAQNAIENAVTMGEDSMRVVMSYGDTGAAIQEKMKELVEDGRIDAELSDVATFCSDLTDTNKELIEASASDGSLLRGVMTSGNIIQTICDRAKAMVNGEEVDEYSMEPLSNVRANEDGSDIVETFYTDCSQLPDTELFFEN